MELKRDLEERMAIRRKAALSERTRLYQEEMGGGEGEAVEDDEEFLSDVSTDDGRSSPFHVQESPVSPCQLSPDKEEKVLQIQMENY